MIMVFIVYAKKSVDVALAVSVCLICLYRCY